MVGYLHPPKLANQELFPEVRKCCQDDWVYHISYITYIPQNIGARVAGWLLAICKLPGSVDMAEPPAWKTNDKASPKVDR